MQSTFTCITAIGEKNICKDTPKYLLKICNCVNCKCSLKNSCYMLTVNVLTLPEMISLRLMTNKSTRNVFNDFTIFPNKTMTQISKTKKILNKQVTRVVETTSVTLVINLVLDFTVHLKTTGRRLNRKRSIKTLISN